MITKDAVLTYERDDKTRVAFTAVESDVFSGVYSFTVTPDQTGEWQMVLYNGEPIEEPLMKLTVLDADTYLAQRDRYQVQRIFGEDRYQTAFEVSKGVYRSEIAVIASGENFADALFGGPLASQVSAPMLLTHKDKLPTGMVEALKDIGVRFVYLLGGENSISAEVESELRSLGYGVNRIAGKDRIETAALISSTTGSLKGVKIIGDIPSVLVNGFDFADALSAAPYAYLLQTIERYGRFIPYSGYNTLQDVVIGVESSVPSEGEMKRIEGENRFETALEVAKAFRVLLKERKGLDLRRIILVDGTNYPEALAAGPLATNNYGAILLTAPDQLSPGIAEFIKENDIESVTIIGGENSVSKAVEAELKGLR